MELSRPLSTVTPTLDGDVLTVLARHDVTFTTGQLHRVLTRHSEEGIRKVLQRLAKQGVVQSDRVGNAFSYRLNRDHLAAEHIIGLAGLQETLLNRLQVRLASWNVPPVYAAVFGSAVHGSMTVDSDLDLLLVRPDDTPDALWDTQVDDLMSNVTRWIGNDARSLQFTATELATHADEEPVLHNVLKEGLTVAGTRAWLNEQLRKRNG
ncbi:MAG: nucleotidyltransferase domain-containing protein [Pseudonocardia sp.]